MHALHVACVASLVLLVLPLAFVLMEVRPRLTRLHEGMLARWCARDPHAEISSVDAEIALDAHGGAIFLQARPYQRRR